MIDIQNLGDYLGKALKTWHKSQDVTAAEEALHATLGVWGEIKEVLEVIDCGATSSCCGAYPQQMLVLDELGDVLYYATILGNRFDKGSASWLETELFTRTPEEFDPRTLIDEGWTATSNLYDVFAEQAQRIKKTLFRSNYTGPAFNYTEVVRAINEVAQASGLNLQAVASFNIGKLRKRYA